MTQKMSQGVRFKANLQRGGTGLREMRRLLEAFAEHEDFERLKRQALDDNLLGKTSTYLIKDLLSAFKRRFLQPSGLPPAHLVALAMRSPMADAAKNHILFPYFICTDALVERCYRDLVLSGSGAPQAKLSAEEVVSHLMALSEMHPELKRWSEYLRLRWARGFLALLRHFGLMERAPHTRLQPLWLLPEAFAFFWLWFLGQGGSFWDAAQRDLWELLQIGENYREELLIEGEMRGWWYYQRLGTIVQFQPRFPGVEEWLRDGLA